MTSTTVPGENEKHGVDYKNTRINRYQNFFLEAYVIISYRLNVAAILYEAVRVNIEY